VAWGFSGAIDVLAELGASVSGTMVGGLGSVRRVSVSGFARAERLFFSACLLLLL